MRAAAPDQAPFQSNCPQRLRGDQLYEALAAALGLPQETARPVGRGAYPNRGGVRGQGRAGLRLRPQRAPRRNHRRHPQALFLMNSPLVNGPIASRAPYATLSRLLAREDDDEIVVVELYLRCLAREPKPGELKTCLD